MTEENRTFHQHEQMDHDYMHAHGIAHNMGVNKKAVNGLDNAQQQQEPELRHNELQPETQGEDEGDGGHRQTPVGLVAAALGFLPLFFQHIEKCQSDHRAQHIQKDANQTHSAINAHVITQHGREYTEANGIAEGIDLDAEALFVLGAAFFGSGTTGISRWGIPL